MRPLLVPARRGVVRRAREATLQQVMATGASGAWSGDGIDDDGVGWRRVGGAFNRDVPLWTQEKARTYSVAAYRVNPMARAIVDTYTAFAVGDKGVRLDTSNDKVGEVAREFWDDPRNNIGDTQDLGLRSLMLTGETVRELMVGPVTGVVRLSPIDPSRVVEVMNFRGNPSWPEGLWLKDTGDDRLLTVAGVDDATGLRDGEAMWWTPWKALDTDTRSMPFLSPVLDWLTSYDTVISNVIDRTALARYLVWDVTVEGGQKEVDDFVKARGGLHAPRSGGIEVHNQSVTWAPKQAETGAYEDKAAASSVLTLIAGGSGLAKTWLAEPEDANRATALSMAEPVRRRVQAVQKVWLGYQTEQVRYCVDRAVAAKRLPSTVTGTNGTTGETRTVAAAQAVRVTGPEIAAADAEITAKTLLNLATGLEKFVQAGVMSREAAGEAARKAWEDYMGIPYRHELGKAEANPDDVADAVDKAAQNNTLRAV